MKPGRKDYLNLDDEHNESDHQWGINGFFGGISATFF
jgi:hypothetical protein